VQGRSWIVLGTAVLIAGACAGARGAQVELGGELEMSVRSDFVWRGEVISDDPVIQPAAMVYADNLSAAARGTWALSSDDDDTWDSRGDLVLDYTAAWRKQLLSAGAIAYIYHDSGVGSQDDTFEAYLGYSVDVPTLPAVTVYYDFQEIEGWYAEFSVGHSFRLGSDRLSLDLGASVAAADEEYVRNVFVVPADEDTGFEGARAEEAGLVDLELSARIVIKLEERFAVTPGYTYSCLLDSDLRDVADAAGMDTDSSIVSVTGSMYF